MKFLSINDTKRTLIKQIIFVLLIFCVILNELFLYFKTPILPFTLSSIFIFILIGVSNKRFSFLSISILSIFSLCLNDFTILNIIIILESFYIWMLYNRNKKNILVNILIFEAIISLPLLLITAINTNGISDIYSLFILLVALLNRVFNGLIAEICLEYIPFKYFMDLPSSQRRRKTLSNLLSFTLLGSVLTPFLIFIIMTTSNNQSQILEKVTADLESCSQSISEKIDSWSDVEKSNLKLNNPIQVKKFMDILNVFTASSNKDLTFYLVDFDNQIVTNNKLTNNMFASMDWLTNGHLSEESPSVFKWVPLKVNGSITESYSPDANYILVSYINNTKLLITISASEYTSITISTYLNLLKILLPLFLLLLFFMLILKRIILNSISNLISITNDLPEKLRTNDSIVFENTNIAEIDSLIFNFQSMVDNLSKMIKNVETTNEKLKKSQKQLFKQANFDYLSGLPNRPYFIKHLKDTLEVFYSEDYYIGKDGIAILFLDLDKFKQVNDSLGHSTGDELLKIVANRMREIMKDYNSKDIFIARLGGDEFVIKFVYSNKNEIDILSDKISAAICETIIIDNNKINISVSIGIALYPEDGLDINSLFVKSDTSMYKAKYANKKQNII